MGSPFEDANKALKKAANAATGGATGAVESALQGDIGGAFGSMMGRGIPGAQELGSQAGSAIGLDSLFDKDKQSSSQRSGIILAPETALEQQARADIAKQYGSLQEMTAGGPGQTDVAKGYQQTQDLANLLQQYAQGGFLPGQQDFATANQFAQQAFAPQQTAINQQFQEEQIRANQLAAQLGRPANDPIIQARLSQERQRAQERLGASQSAFASEFAMNLPQQRLGYTQQLTDVRSALASQAMSNRQALLGLGSQLQGADRQFRIQTGTQWGTGEQESGGGLKGALTTIAGLAGAAGSLMGGFGSMGFKPFARPQSQPQPFQGFENMVPQSSWDDGGDMSPYTNRFGNRDRRRY